MKRLILLASLLACHCAQGFGLDGPTAGTFGNRKPSSGISPLLNNLISYWSLNEPSDGSGAVTRNDSHGANHLTDNNTTASGTGKISNAADFELDNTERLSITDNPEISSGDIDFTVSAWVNIESVPSSAARYFVSKSSTTSGEFEWGLRLNESAGTLRFQFLVSGNGTSFTTVTADNFGTPSTATWYYVVAWHDSVANTINIQVDNGTANSASHTTGSRDGTGPWNIGAINGVLHFDGLVDEVGFWKRTLTADERTSLFNSASGLPYPFQ